MSEKNAGGGGAAHWAKSAAAIQKQQHPIYDGSGNTTSNNSVGHTSNTLYGHCSLPVLHQQPTDIIYTSGRFQTPPIHHGLGSIGVSCATSGPHQSQAPSPSSVRPISTTTNVPVPSGFVPPFPTTPAAAATSVLTPNPFAPAFAVAAGAASALEQFQRLNVQQQQLELGKIVNAMNISGQSATSPAVPTLVGGAQIPVVAAAQQAMASPSLHRSHGEPGVNSANNAGGAINSTIAENVLNAISLGQSGGLHGRLLHVGIKTPDGDKIRRVQQVIESGIDEFSKQTITQILERVSNLKPVERLLLYLRLPGETADSDPLRQPQNPLGTRSEITHTINWVRSHLEHDPQVSIPKQDVYNDYIVYCERLNIKPLSTADFGKVMKQVFPGIRPRRLGTRGNSRYCYAAMRKTTQLVTPQLPQLCRSFASGSPDQPASESNATTSEFNTSGSVAMQTDNDVDSWHVVKSWAEKLLNVKVENLKDLATRIKNGNVIGATGAGLRLGPKKYTPREPKEKRLLADLGPLKKRRKKKRKGSSSSESSCNQLSKDVIGSQETASHIARASAGAPEASLNSEDEQNTLKLVKVKKEIMDSPNYASSQPQMLLPILSPMPQNALLADNYLVTQQLQQQHQHQMMPMNLATEPRTVLSKAPANNALRGQLNVARNLTPKILEMTPNTNTSPQSAVANIAEQSVVAHEPLVTIKDEVDDYSTSNIFCKKVLKAQQTKGFWANNNNNMVTPIITTTASTPPPTSDQIPTTTTNLEHTGSSPVTNLTMGPPAQMSSNTSISPSSSLDVGPKVVSRNSLLLRAKKAMAAEAAADDSGLPENLGLPRERVISICNMDKHELDGYFLGEAENEEDQETELLQYFQTGDAEEKRMNSLDAADNRNPTEHNATPIGTTVSTRLSTTTTATTTATAFASTSTMATSATMSASIAGMKATSNMTTLPMSAGLKAKLPTGRLSNTPVVSSVDSHTVGLHVASQSVAEVGQATSLPQNTTTNALGSASASLALMSQKHQLQHNQQQQQQQLRQKQQQKQQPQSLQAINVGINSNNGNGNNNNNNNKPGAKLNLKNNKRKISLSTAYNLHNNNNKNCIFLPISPNINNQPVHSESSTTAIASISESSTNGKNNYSSGTNVGCFASPGLTRLRNRAPTLTKQQSLDFDAVGSNSNDNGSDPMIGASRRRRSYVNTMNASTSASAPPSPSVLQQVYNSISTWSLGNSNNGNVNVFNDAVNNVALLADQNSMDLESSLALAHATGDVDFQLTPLNETQRSQSVPLSQLQRIQSPTFSRQLENYHNNFSACTSVNQTPVPPDLAGDSSTLFSENSNSQAALKLNDVDVLVQDSSALLDDVVDVSAMLSSDFSTKFASIAHHAQHASATTCSSTGSSSGYSSGTGNAFGSMSSGSGIISRSVPSTPLPHHQQNSFGNSTFYSRRNDDYNLSPLTASGGGLHGFGSASACLALGNSNSNNNNNNNGHGVSVYGSRNAYDISKSMPTTPITTPCFRYSPVELQRDFLINGNTIDSLTSSNFGAGGGGTGDGMGGVGNLSTDTLIDDSAPAGDVEAIIAGSDILGNL